MNFKKDYINYVLYNVIHANGRDFAPFSNNLRIKLVLEKVITADDLVKTTFLIGKTAGMELLFKYLLYISDKIDKSQITIFNLKDNFDYDVQNLKKICEKIELYKSGSVSKTVEKQEEKEEPQIQTTEIETAHSIEIDIGSEHEKELLTSKEEEQKEELAEETKESEEQGMILIEQAFDSAKESEVFELADIEDYEDNKNEEKQESIEPNAIEEEAIVSEQPIVQNKKDEATIEVPGNELVIKEQTAYEEQKKKDVLDFEFEVRSKQYNENNSRISEPIKEETVTNEAYLKFENKFFEEVKILEKLFYYVGRESRQKTISRLSDKMLQSFTEIIEISSELSDLTRQLSFDLTADVFFTINLYFTKAINNPSLITFERIKLLESSLALVNSLIKGEDYLNYDVIVEKIEKLKSELAKPSEKVLESEIEKKEPYKEPDLIKSIDQNISAFKKQTENLQSSEKQIEPSNEIIALPPKEVVETEKYVEAELDITRENEKLSPESQADLETVLFKMKHFVKEFEKTFLTLGNIKGEYIKFDALEKVDELNNSLRMIAKISTSVQMGDVLKLAEVTYVFLKYIKDYRMDLLDSEIQQIIKYIIFTFKMLLTERKPEDFNILVQYLNNPVKIFTDTN